MKLPLIILIVALVGCRTTASDPNKPHVLIKTNLGTIEVELYPLQAPKTAGAFLSYVDSGLFKNASFYRVLSEDNQPSGSGASKLIQGGIWQTNNAKAAAIPGIPHETTQQTHILHTDGVISLARTAPGTASTEFFICVGDQPGFDYGGANNPDGQGYAAFGKVAKGMDVVRTIYDYAARSAGYGQTMSPGIPITDIVRE
jgi:peptidyl-prolyl cis-trans isomerase A (cyclophilin A)